MNFKPFHHLTLQVMQVEAIAADIRRFVLQDPDGWELPPFSAGAHLEVQVPGGGVRHYSLSGDPAVRDCYEIAVLAEPHGRGGSVSMHERVAAGDLVYTSLPRNHFGLDASWSRYLLLAGGIGITPLRAMTFELQRAGKPFELWYCAADEAAAAYSADLRDRLKPEQVHFVFDGRSVGRQLDVASLLREPRVDTALYCCGPAGLLHAVQAATRHWPERAVRFEPFAPASADELLGDHAFEVHLERSGRTVPVRQGQTIVQALREHDIEVAASCEAGVCRSCKTAYRNGTPVHRDLVLTPQEREGSMLICVSACSSGSLVLDL
jgi:ferredoxin-NADP reductase